VTARVLVADDSSVVRELIAVNLELEGLEVVRCVDGMEALERVAEQRPDAITLDVVMPRLDGFAVVERLRADRSTAEIPIVIVTGRASAADLTRGEALGVDAYLTKPFEPSELVATVLRLVDQQH
jgi:CheY-like chemotaxis protein